MFILHFVMLISAMEEIISLWLQKEQGQELDLPKVKEEICEMCHVTSQPFHSALAQATAYGRESVQEVFASARTEKTLGRVECLMLRQSQILWNMQAFFILFVN